MRLKSVEVDAIVQSARDVFGTGVSVALFGSRVDDAQKGGDIDLYIRTAINNDYSHRIQFLVALEQRIGEQKIDVVMAVDSTRAIEQQALKNGVWLC